MAEGIEGVAIRLVELGLELDPVQTKSVKETFHNIHTEQDTGCDSEENNERDVDVETVDNDRTRGKGRHEGFLEEDQRQLLVGQRQRPETQI